MALFKTNPKDPLSAPPEFTAPEGDGIPAVPSGGPSAAECMQVGQLLVDSNQLSADALGSCLQLAGGDLLRFADLALNRFSCGRQEVSLAIGQVLDIPAADTKGIELNAEIVAMLDEQIIRTHQVIPITLEGETLVVLAADPSPYRRAEVEAAAGRPVRWFVGDAATVRTFIDRTHRADADVDRLVKSFEITDDQRTGVAQAAEVAMDD